MNAEFEKKLPIPMEVKQMYPLSDNLALLWKERDRELKDILSGREKKLILIIGPCSADNEESVLDYISRLRGIQDRVKDKLFIIPRIYTNKPRTSGDGYKGLLHQPDPTAKPDLLRGIVATRELHMRAMTETGFTCADELLYPENHKYLDDILGYVSVGARSVEDQQHRLTASAIEVPVGMKNPTSGDLAVMINAIHAAQHQHSFIYRGWAVHSGGNPFAHAILRGYMNKTGGSIPNYHYDDLAALCDTYFAAGLENPACIIDTNHSNSGKNYLEQPRIVSEVLGSMHHNADIGRMVKGFMIESYIEDGAQKIGDGVYGKSITDPCLGWQKTERMILELAENFV